MSVERRAHDLLNHVEGSQRCCVHYEKAVSACQKPNLSLVGFVFPDNTISTERFG